MFAALLKWDASQHPRDVKGQFVTLYHGTRERDVEAIHREGLKPGKEGLVWATESREEAQRFAEGLDYPEPTPGATVVEIRAPKSAFFFEKPLTPGRKSPKGSRTARFAGGVRPEWIVKFDPTQPRDASGKWAKVGGQIAAFKAKYPVTAKHYPRSTHTEMGSIESHTTDVGREWETQLSREDLASISDRFGSDVETLMASAIALHDIGKAEAIEEGEGKEHQHEHTIPILQKVLREEGFSEKDITLATELLNHDLIGPLFRGWSDETDVSVAAKLTAKAKKVGMNPSDFVTLQLAFYQADAAAYPYITQYMTQEPSGRWTFKGRKQIAAIEALTRLALKYSPAQPRDAEGQWTKIIEGAPKDFDKAEYDRLQRGHDINFAIFDYVQGGASYLNDTLRRTGQRHRAQGETWDQGVELESLLGDKVALLDAHMRNNTLSEDTSLTRTVPNYVMDGLNVGDVYQDDGYVSTTKNSSKIDDIRLDIGAYRAENHSILTVLAPKGLGHIDVNEELGAHGYDHQEEVILPRGTRFEVVSKGPGNTMTVKVLQSGTARKVDVTFVKVLRWDEVLHPRDAEGKFSETRGDRSPHEQKRRDFMALVKRSDREGVILDRMRVELADAWKTWSEDLSKGRKKPLKADGAAAKKLESYQRANALEKVFHERFEVASKKRHALNQQARELLKVAPAERSKLEFTDDPKNPLHPGVAAGARRALEQFRRFDGSGAFVPTNIPEDQMGKLREIFGGTEGPFVKNPDGTYAIPAILKLEKSATRRAHATIAGIAIGEGRDLERTVHHEVAHHIELNSSAARQAAINVREQLANKPREVYKLKTVSPALEDDEEALRGKFPDPYSAKLYPHDISTEMVSTGVESYLADPITFARERPEHFNLIFDIMQGKYR